jgi:oligoendopeptidase F
VSASEEILPVWDMTTVFPSMDSAEFEAGFNAVTGGIDSLVALFDKHNVARRTTSEADDAFVAAYEEVIDALGSLQDRLRTLAVYISCFTTTNAQDELAKSRESLLNTRMVALNKLYTRLNAWVGTTDVDALISKSETAKSLEFAVRRAAFLAVHQMAAGEEDLASELASPGISGWAKLHGNLTALLTADVTVNGETRKLPMSAIRSMATDADRAVRKAAYEAEIAAWETAALPLAAALNGVKGYQQVVRRRRGFTTDVEPTLFANGISQKTLDAMQQACTETFPAFRRYMAAKARALGLEKLAWYDVSAPLGGESKRWSWAEAEQFIITNFGRYSERMANFAKRTFDERWIDAGQRVGKVGGAYCAPLRAGESRVLMNYNGSFNSVSTLAHELGHAYHNLNMEHRLPLQRSTPSTLAETASIFCETLAFDGAMAVAAEADQLVLLDTVLERNLMVVVDIHSRFLFEKSVFAKRAERELTITEFKELMTAAQIATYGEDMECLHPFMWAVKGHYYGPTFYNYPYTFGLLFGLGLYAKYQQEPEAFRADYDNFLSSTGMADAVTLGQRFGADVESVDFWRSSLRVITRQIEEFEGLVG